MCIFCSGLFLLPNLHLFRTKAIFRTKKMSSGIRIRSNDGYIISITNYNRNRRRIGSSFCTNAPCKNYPAATRCGIVIWNIAFVFWKISRFEIRLTKKWIDATNERWFSCTRWESLMDFLETRLPETADVRIFDSALTPVFFRCLGFGSTIANFWCVKCILHGRGRLSIVRYEHCRWPKAIAFGRRIWSSSKCTTYLKRLSEFIVDIWR